MGVSKGAVKVLKREEGWIHTYFHTDGLGLGVKDRQRLRWQMESFLRGLSIVFGVHFKEGERLTVVLECVPERRKMEEIERRLGELLAEFKPKPKVTKVRVEGEGGGDKAAGQGDSRG